MPSSIDGEDVDDENGEELSTVQDLAGLSNVTMIKAIAG